MSHCVIWYHIAGKRRLAVEKKYFICTRFFKVYIEMDHLDGNNSLKRKRSLILYIKQSLIKAICD